MRKVVFFALVMICSTLAGQAQDSPLRLSVMGGIGTPILDNGFTYHLGLNPSVNLGNHFAIETQFSFASTKVSGSFLSGEEQSRQNFQALVGPRVYILGPDKTVRPYLSLLAGGMYLRENDPGQMVTTDWGAGVSLGAYVEFKQILAGVSFDTPDNLLLKVGYTF